MSGKVSSDGHRAGGAGGVATPRASPSRDRQPRLYGPAANRRTADLTTERSAKVVIS